jgi:hypothetical protein
VIPLGRHQSAKRSTLVHRMTFAEVILLIGGVVGIYFLLRPLQRCLEASLRRKLCARHPRRHRTVIDVTDVKSYPSPTKEDDEHHS